MSTAVLVGLLFIANQSDPLIPFEVGKLAGNTCFIKVGEGAGTGMILGQEGSTSYVLTCAHILENDDIQISWFEPFPFGETASKKKAGRPVPAREMKGKSKVADLALLSFESKGFTWERVRIPPKEAYFKPKTKVFSVGCEQGYPTIEATQLTARKLLEKPFEDKLFKYPFHWETLDSTKEGRSGGPLLGPKGELMGICHGYKAGRGYYTHSLEILAFLKENGKLQLVRNE